MSDICALAKAMRRFSEEHEWTRVHGPTSLTLTLTLTLALAMAISCLRPEESDRGQGLGGSR